MSGLSETLMPAAKAAAAPKNTVFQRWAALACAIIFIEFAAGCAYAYGIYSASLGEIFGWKDSDLASISSLADIGLYISLDGGFVYDRFGPMSTLLVGAVLCAVGYVLVYLMTAGVLAGSVSVATVFLFIAFHGASWLDTAGVATSLRNFPQNGALVVGLVKAFFGLSGSIISTVYLTFFIARSSSVNSSAPELPECYLNGSHYDTWSAAAAKAADSTDSGALAAAASAAVALDARTPSELHASSATAMPVFLFLAGASLVGPIISSIFTKLVSTGTVDAVTGQADDPPPLRPRQMTKFFAGYGVVAALALVMAGTVVNVRAWAVTSDPTDRTYVYIVFSVVMGLIVALGVVVVVPCGSADGGGGGGVVVGGGGGSVSYRQVVTEHASEEDDEDRGGGGGTTGKHAVTVADEMQQSGTSDGDSEQDDEEAVSAACMAERTLLQSLLSVEFWLLWFVHFFGTGAGLMIINQIAQIALSYGDTKSSAAIFVTIVGTANALGRMLAGLLSQRFKHSVPLPMWYGLASLLMGVGCAMLLVPSTLALYFVCGVGGLAYGMFWTLNPTLAAEISGLKHLGSNYAFLSLSPAAAGYAFNAGLAASLYSHFAQENPPSNSSGQLLHNSTALGVCCGMDCFRWTGLVCVGTCLVGAGLSLLLTFRMRSWYRRRPRV